MDENPDGAVPHGGDSNDACVEDTSTRTDTVGLSVGAVRSSGLVGVGLNGEMGWLGGNEMAQVRSEVLFFPFFLFYF